MADVPVPLFGPPGTKGKLPNALTAARLVMAVVFFILLAFFDERPTASMHWTLLAAMGLFVVAAATDFLDGYLARRWNAISVFGRVMDPFADKILVLGAFVMLAGPNFESETGMMLSGVAPWMVVTIIARELLVTSLRGLCESRGISFGAVRSGKLKMVVQSVSVPLILLLCWLGIGREGEEPNQALLVVNGWIALATTVITALSAIPYLTTGFKGLSRGDRD